MNRFRRLHKTRRRFDRADIEESDGARLYLQSMVVIEAAEKVKKVLTSTRDYDDLFQEIEIAEQGVLDLKKMANDFWHYQGT